MTVDPKPLDLIEDEVLSWLVDELDKGYRVVGVEGGMNDIKGVFCEDVKFIRANF